MPQWQLAKFLKVTQQTICKWERGELIPPPHQQARIAAVLGTTIETLWPPTEDPPARPAGSSAHA